MAFWSRCKISAYEARACAESKISTFYFSLSLLPSFFAFLASFFLSLAGHLVGFILVGRVFRKAFRILGLGERKGRWVMEQDFHGDFQVLVTWFFASFSGVLDWIVLILVWFERSLHPAQVSEESCPWPLKLVTSQRVERTWIRTGGYGRFRGEWVNVLCFVIFIKKKNSSWLYSIIAAFKVRLKGHKQMLWCNFFLGSNAFFLCFKLWFSIVHNHTATQRKTKSKPLMSWTTVFCQILQLNIESVSSLVYLFVTFSMLPKIWKDIIYISLFRVIVIMIVVAKH